MVISHRIKHLLVVSQENTDVGEGHSMSRSEKVQNTIGALLLTWHV